MEIEELAETYAQQSMDNIAVTELYSPMDCSDVKSNVYEINVGNPDDDSVEAYTLRFDKFVAEWTPFVSAEESSSENLVAEGERSPSSRPQELGPSVAEHIYEAFRDAADYGTYHGAPLNGLRDSCETFREYTSSEPEVVVVGDDLLDEKEITGIEEMENVAVYESEYIDLGETALLSNKRLGYFATRTPVKAMGYNTAEGLYLDEDDDHEPTVNEPYAVQVGTRIDSVNVFPECAMAFEPIS